MRILATLIIAVAIGQAYTEKLRFDNHALYSVTPKTPEAVEALHLLEDTPLSGYNFFSPVHKENVPVHILVPPYQIQHFKEMLENGKMESEVMVPDIQKLIDAEGFRPESLAGTFNWTSYHTLDEINIFLRGLADNYPERVTLISAGRTAQNREILGVKVSYGQNNGNHSVFIEANIHAREWITSAVATYLIWQLIVSPENEIRDLAQSYDWYIFPVFNPDGFVHSHTSNRLWRKTRTQYSLLCYGADPNRNWPFEWMQGGASNQMCSDTYAGPNPLSETSTSTMADYISTLGPNLEAYISFHSYSQMLLLPYGHTTAHLDNYDELMFIGRQAIADLATRHGTQYVVGNIAETIYVATGGSMDWVKHAFKTPITYTYELRDRGQNGFILPANQIIPTGDETLDSLVSIFRTWRALHPRN